MQVLAGTSRGVYSINGSGPVAVLESRGVREVQVLADRVFAGTGDGVFVSDDGGQSWTPPMLGGHEVWTVRSAGDRVVYAGTQPAKLFRSDDCGDTWVEVDTFSSLPEAAGWGIPLDPPIPARSRAMVVDRDDPDRMIIGVEVGGIARTTDGGQTWKVSKPGGNPDLHMLFARPDRPSTVFASTGYGRPDHIAEEIEGNAGVFRSDDGGETWTYAWAGIEPRYSRPMCIDHRAPYALTVASAPTAFSSYKDADGSGAMLFRSDDEGESWRSLCDDAHSPSAANFHGLCVDPTNEGGVIVGTDTGEVWQVSADCQWTQLASDLPAVLSLATRP